MSRTAPSNSQDPVDSAGLSLAAYRGLLTSFRSRGYSFVDYPGVRPEDRHVVLRHDVDMCLQRAVEVAKIESNLGIRARYFVLLNTEMYNLSSHRSIDAVRSLLDGGHDIGLHFDASSIVEGDVGRLQSAASDECQLLERITQRRVEVITFHRPAKWLLGFSELLAGRLHGYMPRFFSEIGYCTDSEGRFRYHHPLSHPAVQNGTALQLVTHPIWWCSDPEESALHKLERFHDDRHGLLAEELAENCRPFKESQRLA